MNMPTSEPEFTITRTLNARRELVWPAWTEEKELAGWCDALDKIVEKYP